MDKLISLQAAIDAGLRLCGRDTKAELINLCEASIADSEGWAGGILDYMSELEDLPSAQPEQRWIPTSERLPKVREWVLCQCRAGIIDVLRLTEDGDWNKNYPHAEYMSGFVIAWMPLPEPWEGES